MAPDDNDDKTVKELLDAATRADLERWFGLPSFQEVAETAPRKREDPEVTARREQQERAIAAVDPAMLESHRRRTDPPTDLLQFTPNLEVRVDPSIAKIDPGIFDRQASIAEPREMELPDAIRDDLRECTPQALLRDLHRPVMEFDKRFEVTDFAAENHVVVASIARDVMSTRWRLECLRSTFSEGLELMRELRAARLASWAHALPGLPNRRVTE